MKFIEVVNAEGEILYGYVAWQGYIFYYHPASMVFVGMHAGACDCKMCNWVHDDRAHAPQLGRRSPSNKNHLSNYQASPSQESPRYSLKSPVQSPVTWSELADKCNWQEDPFKAPQAEEP